MLVRKQRRPESRIRCGAFCGGPTVIRTGDAVVDLFPGVLTNVVDEQASGAGLKRERKRIAQAECPDRSIRTRCCVEEGVVVWNRAVGVDTQNFPETIGECLRV